MEDNKGIPDFKFVVGAKKILEEDELHSYIFDQSKLAEVLPFTNSEGRFLEERWADREEWLW